MSAMPRRLTAAAVGLAAAVTAAAAAGDPTVVIGGLQDPVALALDGKDIVWGGSAGLFRARRDGVLPVRLADIKTTAVAVDGGDIFVGGPDAVWRLVAGRPPAVKLAPAHAPARLAVGGGHVYWVQGKIDAGGMLARVPKAGGRVETLLQVDKAAVEGLALDLPDVYVSVRRIDPGADAIMRVRAGGKPETVHTGDVGQCVAVDGNHVYFTSGGLIHDNGRVARLPKRARVADAGAGPEMLAGHLRVPGDLFVHAGFVYALAMGIPGNQGAVTRVPLAGGAVEVLANAQPLPFAITHDSDRVYWTVLASGRGAILSHPLQPAPGAPLPLIAPLPSVCVGADLDLDTVLRAADDCWPRTATTPTGDRVKLRIQPDPVIIAAAKTAAVTVSLQNATPAPLSLALEVITGASEPRVEVLRALGKTGSCEPVGARPTTRMLGVQLPPGGSLTRRLTIAPSIVDIDDGCRETLRVPARGRYRLRVETPFYDPATQGGRFAEGTLVVK
jgi:hypothetical protein